MLSHPVLFDSDPTDCSPSGSSVHGILQARGLERVAVFFSRRSSRPRDQTHVSCVSCTSRQVLHHQRHLGSPRSPEPGSPPSLCTRGEDWESRRASASLGFSFYKKKTYCPSPTLNITKHKKSGTSSSSSRNVLPGRAAALRVGSWARELLDAAGSTPKANVCPSCKQACPQWGMAPIVALLSELTGGLGQEVCKAPKHPKCPQCTPLAPARQLDGALQWPPRSHLGAPAVTMLSSPDPSTPPPAFPLW